jgi:hypothetical protein
MVDFLRGLDGDQRDRIRTELRQNTVDLSSALGRKVQFEEVVPVLRWGFEKSWGMEFSNLGMNAEMTISGKEVSTIDTKSTGRESPQGVV